MKSKLTTALLIIILIIGVGLIFVNPIQNKLIASNSQALLNYVLSEVSYPTNNI